MNEHLFYEAVNSKAKELGLNPLLLISGIEGLYTFRNVQLNAVNYEFLDSLILTIFALRVGDGFHTIAEENLSSPTLVVQQAAAAELREISDDEIGRSANVYLQSFATVLSGKSTIRGYHIKALEVAALEIKKAQLAFSNHSISIIIMDICKKDVSGALNLEAIFNQ